MLEEALRADKGVMKGLLLNFSPVKRWAPPDVYPLMSFPGSLGDFAVIITPTVNTEKAGFTAGRSAVAMFALQGDASLLRLCLGLKHGVRKSTSADLQVDERDGHSIASAVRQQLTASAGNQRLHPPHLPLLFSLRDDIRDTGQQQQVEEEEEFLSSLETTVLSFFLSVIIVMTVFGNLLVMVALCKDRHLR